MRHIAEVGSKITDRERILMHILAKAMLRLSVYDKAKIPEFWRGQPDVHFAAYRKPVAGDLVWAQTGGPSEWALSWYVEPREYECGALVREVGSERLCRYDNEGFIPIDGLGPEVLIDGKRREFRDKVLAAFRRGGEDWYRYGGTVFDGDTATVWIREKWNGAFGNNLGSVPFSVEFAWRERWTIKSILCEMVKAGYGTRRFDRVQGPEADPHAHR